MKVREVMVQDVKICTPVMNLAAVAEILWKEGCGTLPVVENARVMGMITDRDICIALGTRNVRAAEAVVRDVALPKVFYCAPDDDIHKALSTMSAQKIRRLPVINNEGILEGILCLDDIVLHAEAKAADLTYADVMKTLKAICEHERAHLSLAVAR